jgi:hypothetical protein
LYEREKSSFRGKKFQSLARAAVGHSLTFDLYSIFSMLSVLLSLLLLLLLSLLLLL